MPQPGVIAYTPDLTPDPASLDLGALDWRTSSYSSGQGGNCVQVAQVPGGGIAARNSTFPERPATTFSDNEWRAFLLGVAAQEFDLNRP